MLSGLGKVFKRRKVVEAPAGEKPMMRVLEPRILLDAAGVQTASDMVTQSVHADLAVLAVLADLAVPADANIAENKLDDALSPDEQVLSEPHDLSRDVVFIDGGVENIGSLLADLDPDVEVHILDLQSDGVEQIASILEGRQDLLSIHIFSHGDEGVLNLGSGQMSLETISGAHSDALATIGAVLGEDGDILIYGCDFGAGDAGRQAAVQLSLVTGADVAASDDLTGSREHGGDWDLEVVEGTIEAKALEATGFKGVLGTFELGTVDPPDVAYVNSFVPASAPQYGAVGEVGTVAIWENAGTVETADGPVNVDVRATVTNVTNASEIFVGFGTRDDDDGDNDDPTLDDFRVYVHNTSAVDGGSDSGNMGSATIVWEIFQTDTNQTVRAEIGEVSLTTADIDGVGGDGSVTTRETLAAALADLSSYTVQAGTNLVVGNDGTNLRATGTADQNSEESSWVQYSWNSINQLTMTYETRTPYAYYNHDGDGDLVFTNPDTAYATGIDLDADDSSLATGSNYHTIFYSNDTSGSPVAIADGDILVTNAAGTATSAVIVLTNAFAGDQLNVETAILTSLGLTSSVDTGVAGQITVTLSGSASATDYQTAIQSITYENTNYGSMDETPRSIDVQVFDGAFASGVANAAVSFSVIVNQPSANRDVYVGQEDTLLQTTVSNGLLANDTDPNGIAIFIAEAFDSSDAAIAVNPVGSGTPTSHTMPSGAVITLYADGTFDYQPLADFSGVEHFNYIVENLNGFKTQSYAAINTQGIADTPVLPVGLVSTAVDEDMASHSLDLTSFQADADGSESLRYSVSSIPAGYTLSDGVRNFLSDDAGDIAYLDGWDVDNISLIPPSPDQHSDLDVVVQLTVEASEPNGSTISTSENVTFQFDAAADAPALTVSAGSAGPGAMMNISPLISASLLDIDGSETILEYQFSSIPTGATFYVGLLAQTPVGGVVTVAAADLAALRLQVPVPLNTYSVNVMAVSSETNAENQISQLTANSTVEVLSFSVDDANDPVTAVNDTYTVFSGQTVTLNPLANDDVPDGGGTIISVAGNAILPGETVNLTGIGDVTLNLDGTITLVADSALSGQASFDYIVEDIDFSTDTATITIDAPTWTIAGGGTVAEGASGSYTITLDAVVPMGSPVSVDISAINIDTTNADYADLAAAVQLAADASPYFEFDGTTLSYSSDYGSVSAGGSNFQDISANTDATALGIGLYDPRQVAMGFDFEFYGQAYSDIYVSDFGVLTFEGPSPGGGTAYNNSSFSAGNTLGGLPAIAPFWDVLGLNQSNSDDVYTLTQGLPGEREFIVQYNDVVNYFTNSSTETLTFQVVLREGSNEIEFRYDDVTLSNSSNSLGRSATVGLSDGTGNRFEQFSYNEADLADNSRIVFSVDNDAANQVLNFSLDAVSDSDYEAAEGFQIQLTNAQNSAVLSASQIASTTITDTNAPPVNGVPVTGGSAIASTTTAEDTPLVFSAANTNAITIDDPDGDAVTVILSVTNGVLTVSPGSGAAVSDDGSPVVTLSGTKDQVNAALDGLTFTNTPDFNGAALLTVTTDDNEGLANSVAVNTIDLAISAVSDVVDDMREIQIGNSIDIDVLGNDSFEGTVTNIIASNGSNGTVSVNDDNSLTYSWTGGVSGGTDSFTYTVTSGGVVETATVAIVKNPLPLPVDDTGSTDEDSVLAVDAAGGVLSNDSTAPPVAILRYDTIDAAAQTWDDGSNSLPLTWAGGVGHSSSPATGFSGITDSLVFDGTGGATGSDLAALAGNPSDDSASFELWFRFDPVDYPLGAQGAILYESGDGGDGISIALSDSAGGSSGPIDHVQLQINDGGAVATLRADLASTVGAANIAPEFIQVTAVYGRDVSGSTDTVQLFINGLLVAETSNTSLNDWSNSNTAALGTASNSPNVGTTDFGNFIGEIAGFSLHETALTSLEVKNLFDDIAGLNVISHDSTSALGATIVVNSDGSYSYDPTGSAALQAMQSGDVLVDTFTYTVEDGNGTQNAATVSITVAGMNDAPAGSDIAVTIAEDANYLLRPVDFGFDDPVDGVNDGFDAVYFTSVPADGDLVYDDGFAVPSTIVAGQTVSVADLTAGYVRFVPEPDGNNSMTPGPSYTSFAFQLIDDGGTSGSGNDTDASANIFTINVTPAQDLITTTVPGSQTTPEDTSLAIAGVSVTNPDGDVITTTVAVPVSSGAVNVATGTGATVSGNGSPLVTLVGTAVQINASLQGLNYVPLADFNTGPAGTIDIVVTTTNGVSPDVATTAIAVTPVVDIASDGVTTDEDTTLVFDAIGGTAGANADNFENSLAAVTDVTQGTNGTVSINGSGDIVYTPSTHFHGSDSFTYTVTSGGVTETATVTMTVNPVNDAPEALNDAASLDEDTALTVDAASGVLSNDSDLDGDGITVSGFAVDGLTLAAGATANLTEGDLTLYGDGSYTFTPAANFNGAVPQVTYTITDGNLTDTATLDITVDPVNDAPEALNDAASLDEDTALTVDAASGVLLNDSDLDGDGITVSGFTVDGLTLAAGATANLTEGDLTLYGDGSYTFTPASNFNGAVPQVTYTITDGNLTDTATLDITVDPVNDAPEALNDAASIDEDTALTVDAASGVLSNDSDLDGDGITVSGFTVDGLTLAAGATANLTEGDLTLYGDGSYTFTPASNFNGAVPQVTYTITDGNLTDTATLDITVDPVNDAPEALNDAASIDEDTALTVDAASGVLSNDSDLDGDGITVSGFAVDGLTLAAGATANLTEGDLTLYGDGSYTFVPAANFNGAVPQVTYTITDGNLTDTATLDITVDPVNDAPEALNDAASTDEDNALTVDAISGVLSNDSDLDGDGITVSGFTVDGLTLAAGATANLTEGDLTLYGDGSYTFAPATNFNGAVPQVTYTITDGNLTDTATLDITVDPVNDAPEALNNADNTDEDAALTVDAISGVLSNDSDLDGDGITVSGFTVDGLTLAAGATANLTEGDLTLYGDGSYTFTPATNFNGAVPQVTYTITDGNLTDTATLDITVDPVNDAPEALNDAASTDEDNALTVDAISGVLSNDSDLDGDGITVSGFAVDGLTLAAGATANLTEGDLTLYGDGSYTFAPASNFNGAVPQVTYTITDGNLTDTATLDITVNPVNDAPEALNDTASLDEDMALTVDAASGVLSNDSDIDGDGFLVDVFSVDGIVGTFTAGDTAVIAGVGSLTLTPNGSYTFAPAANFNGAVPQVTYTITDGNLTDTATLDITVDPVNDAPEALNDAASLDEDTALTVDAASGVLSNDSDLDGDGITVSGFAVDGLTLAAGATANLTEGDLTLYGDGSYTFTPASNFNGAVPQVTYTITDGNLTDTATLDITVDPVNDAPEALNDAASIDEDTALTVDAASGVLSNDSDLDGDGITVSGFTVDGLTLAAGATANLTEGDLTLYGDGSYTFVPAANFNGAVPQVTYTITDGNLTDTATLDITVDPVNDAPEALNDAASTDEDNALTVDAISGVLSNDSDLDGDGITVSGFTVDGLTLAAGATANLTEGDLTLYGDGSYTFAPATNFNGTVPQVTYAITDGNLTDTATLDITVDPVNDVPSVTVSPATLSEDSTANGAAVVFDIDGDIPLASLLNAPAHGTASVNPDGSWTYTANPDFNGADQFEILVDDQNGGSATAFIDLTITPVADIANDALVTAEDTAAIINVLSGLGTAGGPGGPGADSFEASPVVSAVSQGAHGSVVFSATGDVTYTPDANFNGPDSFTYTVLSGGVEETATVAVSVSSVNDNPTATASPQITDEDTPVSDVITMADVDGDSPVAVSTIQPTNGTAVVGLDGSWTYTPNDNYHGDDTFTIAVEDGQGGTAFITVEVTVLPINDAPDSPSKSLEVIATRPTPLELVLPRDVDDAEDVLRSTVLQIPDAAQGVLNYVQDGSLSADTPVTVGLVLTNQQLSTIVFTANNNYYGPVVPLVYQTSDDQGGSDVGSLATIELTVVQDSSGSMILTRGPVDLVNVSGPPTLLEDVINPIVVTAVNELESLGGTSRLDGEEGIVHDTIDDIVQIDATEPTAGADPAVLKAVHATEALKKAHLDDARPILQAQADWNLESLTGHSVKFDYHGDALNGDAGTTDSGQLVIETYVRDRVLFIDVTNTFDPDLQGTVKEYRVTMANDEPLPDWIRVVRDGFVVAERPANLWDLNLNISAAMDDGSLITRSVVIDGPTGEIQPMEFASVQGTKEDGQMFEERIRMLDSV